MALFSSSKAIAIIVLAFSVISNARPQDIVPQMASSCTIKEMILLAHPPTPIPNAFYYTGSPVDWSKVTACGAATGKVHITNVFPDYQEHIARCGEVDAWTAMSKAMARLTTGDAVCIKGEGPEGRYWLMEKQELIANANVTSVKMLDCDGKEIEVVKR